MKYVLVVVDYQRDFVDGALGFAGAEKLERPIAEKVEQTLADGGWVVFTRDTHGENYLNTREGELLPLPHCIKGTPGHGLYGSLARYEQQQNPRVLVVDKPGFGSAALAGEIAGLCGGEPGRVELCGLVLDICVISNAILLHSAFPKAQIKVLPGLCGSPNQQKEKAALLVLEGLGMV